jgi:serine/threonine protein kinase
LRQILRLVGVLNEDQKKLLNRPIVLQPIGSGGMGEVWLAEQKQPVRRRVAIKLIKAGMDTREVVARFESERQALALMDHPNIAKVFDAGSTPQGRPYFVMEYVTGIPITEYCDKHKMTLRQRLELFVHVCEGVQHAHQKAIIHRDLKPSNILVGEWTGSRCRGSSILAWPKPPRSG